MRRWHRWVAIPAGLILFFVALTGVLLHLDMIRIGQSPPGQEPVRATPPGPIPSDEELTAMIVRLADAARADPELHASELRIDLTGPQIVLIAGAGVGPGPGRAQIRLDALTGKRLANPPAKADYHYILQDLHAGYFLGWPGRILSIVTGIALLVLGVTGIQLWWTMRKRGGKGIYWK